MYSTTELASRATKPLGAERTQQALDQSATPTGLRASPVERGGAATLLVRPQAGGGELVRVVVASPREYGGGDRVPWPCTFAEERAYGGSDAFAQGPSVAHARTVA